ncbi:MAG TPA: HTH domain-containing protein [Polyangiaceae bacterium]|jgi:hypothetical protein
MDLSFASAARALAQGDALGALKAIGRRTDPSGRALRAVALAQLGDFRAAKVHVRAALRALGPGPAALRARCLAVEAEIALATGDLRWNAEPVVKALAELRAVGDARNADYLQLVAARAALRLGMPADAERLFAAGAFAGTLPIDRAYAELVRVELAAKRGDAASLERALTGAARAAERCASPTLLAEVARLRDAYEGPSVVVTSRGAARMAAFLDVCALKRSGALVIDGGTREVCAGDRALSLARKPVLFELLRGLAERSPQGATRDALIARGFGARRPNASHRSRLRVEIGRLRALLRGLLDVVATDAGYALRATREITLVMPLEESADSRLLALMQHGEPWSASSLAVALGVSARTAQRSLVLLESSGKVASRGTGRAQRWVRLGETPTDLLLPASERAP